MKILFVLLIFLTACSNEQVKENFNLKTDDNSIKTQTNNSADLTKTISVTYDWAITMNETYMRKAVVRSVGKSPNGEVDTTFELQCPTKENQVTTFTYKVWNPRQIPNFNFDYFEGPDAPALKEKLVSIQAHSPDKSLDWQFSTAGLYGGFAEIIAFEFSPSTFNKPDKTAQLAQMIAKGSTEVIITVQDNRDKNKTIKSTFPAINPKSDVANILAGCRK